VNITDDVDRERQVSEAIEQLGGSIDIPVTVREIDAQPIATARP
jgi:hypothetical protein